MRLKLLAMTTLAASGQAFDIPLGGRDHRALARRAKNQGGAIASLDDDALCLGVDKQRAQNNQAVVLQPCHDNKTAKWRLQDGALKTGNNFCLDVPEGRNHNGQALQVYTCYAGNSNQQWQREGSQLRWRNTDKCLDITDGCLNEETPLQLWQCFDGNTNQAFVMDPLVAPLASATVGSAAAVSNAPKISQTSRVTAPPTAPSAPQVKAQQPSAVAPSSAQGSVTDAGSFSGYSYISFDAFMALHPVLSPLRQDILDAAASVNINLPPILLAAQALQESSGNPRTAGGGLGQFSPGTWASFGEGDINNGRDNLYAMARYLAYLLKSHGGSLNGALNEYSGGLSFYQGDIRRWLQGEYVYGAGT